MCGYDTTDFARQPWSIETLLNDPLVGMVMHADGATKEDLLTALKIAYRANSRVSNWSSDGFCCTLVLPVQSGRNRGMTRRRRAPEVRQDQAFKGRQFTAEVILGAVRWYLMFPVSCHVRFQEEVSLTETSSPA
jgi:hypothetical protein